MNDTVLVAGGAGYVGSHIVAALCDSGRSVVVVDDLSSGHRGAVPAEVPFVHADIADRDRIVALARHHRVGAAIHCAALIQVGESMRQPRRYWVANVAKTLQFVDALAQAGCARVVFSSTAAVYGDPLRVPIDEDHPLLPTSVYGRTKLAVEQALLDLARASEARVAVLRYFNAAGAHPDRAIGEDHPDESHLVPLALRAAAGRAAPLQVFGADWPTADGTCVRDYVHVCDLAAAHLAALAALDREAALVCNLGSGSGHSVREVLNAVGRATGRPVPHTIEPRRAGDPAVLVASCGRARELLGWQPRLADLDAIVASAWKWERGRVW